ncbi:MAG: hypothetical protein ABL929_09275, partial [Ferruginibacter sp.]
MAITLKAENIEIVYIKTESDLLKTIAILENKKTIGFDTEFDRFWKSYGFNLLLLQIYDGEK